MKNTLLKAIFMRKKIIISALVALLLLLSACSSSQAPTPPTPPATEPTATETEEAPAATEVAEKQETYYSRETLPDYEHKAREVVVSDEDVTFIDGTGVEKTIAKNLERVVGLYPSHIVLWYEAGGSMVGRITTATSESRMPADSKDIEIVGDSNSPDKMSYEKIMAVQPQLVILGIGSQSTMVEKFAELGVEAIVIDNETLDDYLKWVKIIANLNGKPEIYDEVVETVLKPIQDILLQVPAENHPKVLMMQVNDKGSLVAYLPGTTAGGIMDDLRGENIAVRSTNREHDRASGIDKTDLSFEYLLEDPPQLILLKHSVLADGVKAREMVAEVMAENTIWQSLEAVMNDEIYDLPPDYFHYKATLEFPQAYEYMAKILYPEIFGAQSKEYE
jgi:iron complex transport system substrate-binding protein